MPISSVFRSVASSRLPLPKPHTRYQEVDRLEKLLPIIESGGYEHVYAAGPRKKHGSLIAYRRGVFTKIKTHVLHFDTAQVRDKSGGDADRGCTGLSHVTKNVANIVALKREGTENNGVIVATTHLFWHPSYVHLEPIDAHCSSQRSTDTHTNVPGNARPLSALRYVASTLLPDKQASFSARSPSSAMPTTAPTGRASSRVVRAPHLHLHLLVTPHPRDRLQLLPDRPRLLPPRRRAPPPRPTRPPLPIPRCPPLRRPHRRSPQHPATRHQQRQQRRRRRRRRRGRRGPRPRHQERAPRTPRRRPTHRRRAHRALRDPRAPAQRVRRRTAAARAQRRAVHRALRRPPRAPARAPGRVRARMDELHALLENRARCASVPTP